MVKNKSLTGEVNNKLLAVSAVVILVLLTATLYFVTQTQKISLIGKLISPQQIAKEEENLIKGRPATTPTPAPTPTATPKPLTFAELNQLYGPCTVLPTLMYHHVQNLTVAEAQGHKSLTVDPIIFRQQMQYLKDHSYTVVPVETLISFFDTGTPIPKKSVILTFDDGYDDFGTEAAPILKEFGFTATMFIPTGLMQNGGYLTWSTIQDIATTQAVLMANHTWSHHNMATTHAEIEREITLADTQLTEHGLGSPKVFAYPYGIVSAYSEAFLQTQDYKLAFTTVYGSTQCKKQRLTLPRIRIGNASLSTYGL